MTIDENHPFSSFGLSGAMLQAIARKGWTAPSSIQSIALPRLLADEGHCIVKARTGTGKTAAFGIPLIEKLTTAGHAPRALILAPTRELALQVAREIGSLVFDHYPRITAVYGGASIRNQILDLRRGTEIVVGTPGRVMDLMERKALDVSAVDWFILDEADEMLDMGFFEDVEKILAAVNAAEKDRAAAEIAAVTGEPVAGGENAGKEPAVIRTGSLKSSLHVALFSATMPEPILKVIRKHIGNAEIIVDSVPEDEKPLVDQFCIIVRREDKLEALRRLIDSAAEFYGLIFCATKAETDELARRLVEAGYPAEAIHGDLSQEIRERTLRRFRLHRAAAASGGTGEPAILVATDVAARGLDIENLSHVINWDLPNDRETYVHRIGRTGRAGRRGIAISLATLADRFRLQQLSKMAEKNLGSGILWLKVPSVKAVMKTLRRRVTSAVLAVFPELPVPENISPAAIAVPTADESSGENGAAVAGVLAADVAAAALPVRDNAAEGGPAAALTTPVAVVTAAPASPFLAKVCRGLIEQLGAEKAVEALVTLSYGEMLDPARYSPITEFSEDDFNNAVKGFARGAAMGGGRGRDDRKRGRPLAEGRRHSPPGQYDITPKRGHPSRPREEGTAADYLRVYVGMGKQHDCGARDIAALLGKAGGVPGRLVDEIQMKDYCAFATLPADAARKACAFSKKSPREPVIRLANPVEHSK